MSDEGLELSAMLSDSINQGSLDIQNEETVIGKWKRASINENESDNKKIGVKKQLLGEVLVIR